MIGKASSFKSKLYFVFLTCYTCAYSVSYSAKFDLPINNNSQLFYLICAHLLPYGWQVRICEDAF